MGDDPEKRPDQPERRPDPQKAARDAGAEIGEVARRAAAALGPLVEQVGDRVSEAISGVFGGGGRAGALASHVVPELAPLHPMAPGDEVETRVRLVNGEDSATEPFALSSTELTSEAGDKIPAETVVVPSQERVVAGKSSDTIPVTLRVPADAKPGIYRGELTAGDGGVENVPLVLEVR
jgi:hypothetical protein